MQLKNVMKILNLSKWPKRCILILFVTGGGNKLECMSLAISYGIACLRGRPRAWPNGATMGVNPNIEQT
jgi:hypothetical protein